MLLDCRDELLRRHLHAEVDHREACALEHDVDEVLADVVHVALDRAHEEGADALYAALSEKGTQQVECTGHRLAGDEHLRHEPVTALEAGADLLEGGDERLEEHALRRQTAVDAGLSELEHRGLVAHHGLVVEALEDLVGSHAAPAFRAVGVGIADRVGRSAAEMSSAA